MNKINLNQQFSRNDNSEYHKHQKTEQTLTVRQSVRQTQSVNPKKLMRLKGAKMTAVFLNK